MSLEFANITQMEFEPGAAQVDFTSTGEAYQTPTHLQPKIGDMARLKYLRAKWAIDLDSSAAGTAEVTVDLLQSTTVVATTTFSAINGRVGEQIEVDLSSVPGSAGLSVRITVGTAEAVQADLKSWLILEHPLVISNC